MGGPLAGQLPAYMVTPKGLLAYIASRLRFAQQASAVHIALHKLLLAVCSHMVDGRLTLDDGLRVDMAGGRDQCAKVLARACHQHPKTVARGRVVVAARFLEAQTRRLRALRASCEVCRPLVCERRGEMV